MGKKPIRIDTWTTSDGEFCARFCVNRGHHPFNMARVIYKKLVELHPSEGYYLVSLSRSLLFKSRSKNWFVARFRKESYGS